MDYINSSSNPAFYWKVYNIEVKSPTIDLTEQSKQNLKVNMSYRTVPLEQFNSSKMFVENEIINKFISNSSGQTELMLLLWQKKTCISIIIFHSYPLNLCNFKLSG